MRKKPPAGTPQQLVSDPSVQQLLQQSQTHTSAEANQLLQRQQQQGGSSNGGPPHAQQQPSPSHAGGAPGAAPASSQLPPISLLLSAGSHGGARAIPQASSHPQSPQGVVSEQRSAKPTQASPTAQQRWQAGQEHSFFVKDSPFNQGPRPGLPASFLAAQQTQARPFKPTPRRANAPRGPDHPTQAAQLGNNHTNNNNLHPNPQCSLHPSRQSGGNPQPHLSGFPNSPPPPFGAIPPQSAARPSNSAQGMGPLRGHPLGSSAGAMPNGPALGPHMGSPHAGAAGGLQMGGPHAAMPHPASGRGLGRQSGRFSLNLLLLLVAAAG